MKNLFAVPLVTTCLLATAHLPVQAQTPTAPKASPAELARIQAVVDEFRTAIITKDKAKFLNLFTRDNIPWIGVTAGADLARQRQHYPDLKADKAPLDWDPVSFINGIASNPAPSEEKFSSIQIDSDGEVAAVRFDYSFHASGQMTNWGKEAWQLVNTESGWKIASVVWSMRFPSEPAPPARQEVALPPGQLAALAGIYEVKPGNVLEVALDGQRLRATRFGNTFPLYALSATQFFDKAVGSVYDFARDANGVVTQVDIQNGGKTIKAVRK